MVAIATIALAIGANTAVFSLVNSLLLRPLPYPDAGRIVRVLERLPSGGLNSISSANYLDWAEQNSVFEYIAAEAGWRPTVTGGTEPVVIRGARASARYFDIFGTRPALGRTFLPGDDQPGKGRVVLLSHRLWESRFGSDPSLLGRHIILDGEAYLVIGVLEKDGPFDRAAAQIWTPLVFESPTTSRDYRWLGASARLKPGVTLQQARAEMDVIAQRLAAAYPGTNEGRGVAVDRLADVLIGPDLRTAVILLFAATGSVLLIACANLANLALARGLSRQREVAVRAALGATRWRVIRQFFVEHLVIAACGGIAGIGVGYAALEWIRSLIPPHALPPAVDISMDTSTLLFTLLVTGATGLLFGSVPAARATSPNLVGALKDGGHGTTSGSPAQRMRSTLVIAEIALAFVLLVASGLLMRSFVKLLEVDLGFITTNVLTAGLPVTPGRHPDPVALNTYLSSILAAVRAVPGVSDAALTSALPLQGWGFGTPYSIAGRKAGDRRSRRSGFLKIVSPSYFDALGIRLKSGRRLRDTDARGTTPVAVINHTLARREFGDDNPVGHRILARAMVPGRTELGEEVAWEIVGVITGEKLTGLDDESSAGMYVSNQQSPTYEMHLVVRAGMAPQVLQSAIRAAVDGVNKDQAVSDDRTLEQIVEGAMLGNRVMSQLFTTFAVIALLLAAVGIYGVMAFAVSQRTHEMGIRAALGASTGSLRASVVLAGVRLTVIGLVIGLVATFVATDVLSSLVYGIAVHDPLTIAVVAAVLSGVALLACVLPVWRITKVDAMAVLRQQ